MTKRLLLAEFDSAGDLVAATRRAAKMEGVQYIETYSPFALEEVFEPVGAPPSTVRTVMVATAILGGLAAFAMQTWSAVWSYPFNSGGRPLFAWPAFMLVTFEITVLSAAVFGFVVMLWRNGLPQLHHPVFEWRGFERASDDRFFLEIALAGECGALADEMRMMGALSLQERTA